MERIRPKSDGFRPCQAAKGRLVDESAEPTANSFRKCVAIGLAELPHETDVPIGWATDQIHADQLRFDSFLTADLEALVEQARCIIVPEMQDPHRSAAPCHRDDRLLADVGKLVVAAPLEHQQE